ncbi:hypothetical protein [Aliivibrio fischeri]|uniref:Uncharacterized protein n=1 Tax=Aliivibrio fischeri SR5 TaxID=1088719 RepID=A0AAV3EMU2_ALIFS|nr:hypothetical protein [Aliivibrio fischeri]EHN68017.1 hypothetical protein VFSR5_2742 [Aliivibrio fischeri SR5]
MNTRRILELKKRRRRKLEVYFRIKAEREAYEQRLQLAFHEYQNKRSTMDRKHADFFESIDKETKELGIAMTFFQLLESQLDENLVQVYLAEDPPDVAVVTDKETSFGIEITELVSEKAIGLDIKNKREQYLIEILSWNAQSLQSKLKKIITSKAEKCAKIESSYDHLVLLIFTDEPRLSSDVIKSFLPEMELPNLSPFDLVYILTSYEPQNKGYGLIQVGT